jgi:hypothetical protein
METDKISPIKELDTIRETLIKSTFYDLSMVLNLLNKARIVAQKAPLRTMIRYDGTPFTNIEERQLFLTFLSREINDLRIIKKEFYNSYKLQVANTLIQLMISISSVGIPELEKIINQ